MTRPSGISWGEEEAEQEEEPTERPGGVARENRRGGFRADSEISPILEGWFATPLCVCVPRACVRGRGHPFSSRETPNLLTLVHLLPTDLRLLSLRVFATGNRIICKIKGYTIDVSLVAMGT